MGKRDGSEVVLGLKLLAESATVLYSTVLKDELDSAFYTYSTAVQNRDLPCQVALSDLLVKGSGRELAITPASRSTTKSLEANAVCTKLLSYAQPRTHNEQIKPSHL